MGVRTPLKNHKNIGFLSNTSPASLVMPNGDPRDGFFYPTLTPMVDSYIPSLGRAGIGYMRYMFGKAAKIYSKKKKKKEHKNNEDPDADTKSEPSYAILVLIAWPSNTAYARNQQTFTARKPNLWMGHV